MTGSAVHNGTDAPMSTAGWNSVQGGRPYNEDAHLSEAEFLPTRSSSFQLHAVFDGHGGASVSQFCVERIPVSLRGLLQSRLNEDDLDQPGTEAVSWVKAALEEAVVGINPQLQSADSKKFLWMGSTAVICLIYKQHVWVANTGDSRAVRGRAGGVVALTQDHKASCPDEQQRITQQGGQVINNGGPRLMGVLAVTRAIGDLALLDYGLTPRPDTLHFQRDDEDEFLILASDGLWDVITNKEAAQLVRRVFHKIDASSSQCDACRVASSVLTRVALRKHSRDNITALVIDLRPSHRAASRACYVSTRQPLADTCGPEEAEEALARSALAALMAAPKPTGRRRSQPAPTLATRSHLDTPTEADAPHACPQLLPPAALTDASQFLSFLAPPAGYTDDIGALLALQQQQQQKQQQPEDMAMLYPYAWAPLDMTSPGAFVPLAGYHQQSMDDLVSLQFAQEQQQQQLVLQASCRDTHASEPLLLGTTFFQQEQQPHQHKKVQHQHQEPGLRTAPTLRVGTTASATPGVQRSGGKARLRLQTAKQEQAVASPGKRRRASDDVDVIGNEMDTAVYPVLMYHTAADAYTYGIQSGAVQAC